MTFSRLANQLVIQWAVYVLACVVLEVCGYVAEQ